jgi:hypothetical protein
MATVAGVASEAASLATPSAATANAAAMTITTRARNRGMRTHLYIR